MPRRVNAQAGWYKPAAQRYLALCQPTMQQCEKIRGPNKGADVSRSAFVSADLNAANWKPNSGGVDGARYQYAATPFGPPFPHP